MIKDVVFFVTFAVTVTSSVKLAGVLIVFALLVSPALIAMKIGRGRPLIVAWIIGTAVNLLAIVLSYQLDFPTGYSLVFVHALFALVVTMIVKKKESGDNCG